ncbi:MAG TPA: NAD(P)-binding domain-containing protein [Actinophytocola sp.]|uniref:NAD(P)-binding domain-containing protein n=1 Tax=Actinophytocola sp. TaxID=1872138 RepID=UPI002DDCA9C2|nr:NAD(P)-binding domain-containing protein [Actinophytocola sp.]HEV2779265.1 NAD(P)-binding domain-containing protein [Actinophytocola sp.]
MRVGIIGSGRIGGNLGRLLAAAGHEVIFSFSRTTEVLKELAAAAGPTASAGSPADAARADVSSCRFPGAASRSRSSRRATFRAGW